jgi:hypothetical protein
VPARLRLPQSGPGVSILTLTLLACADGSPAANSTVRDSAGVSIVENHGAEASLPHWTAGPDIALEIGDIAGRPEREFNGITGVMLPADGGVVVSDAGSREIRAFAADGTHRWTAGRPGEGPGEFGGEISLFGFRGDSLLAWDFVQRRITVLSAAGAVARIVSLAHLQPNGELRGALRDGSLLVTTRTLRLSPGSNRDSVGWMLADADSARVVRPLVAGHESEVVLRVVDGFPVIDNRPLGAVSAGVAAGDRFALSPGGTPELRLFAPAGALQSLVRWDAPVAPLDAGTAEHWRAEHLAAARGEGDRRLRELWLELATFPPTLPVAARVLADDGRVYVQRFRLPWDTGSATWLVFEDGARLEAVVETPVALDVRAFRGDVVAGVVKDSLDVERLRLYRLRH